MRQILSLPIALIAASAAAAVLPAARGDDSFAAAAGKAAQDAYGAQQFGWRGADQAWWFLPAELEHLGTGAFWTKDWAEVSEAKADPAPIIADYAKALKDLGIDLLVVPVPPKAAIYPEKFHAGAKEDAAADPAPFYAALEKVGVNVFDIAPLLRKMRAADPDGPGRPYCRQDSHWSPAACKAVAEAIAAKFAGEDWAKAEAAKAGGFLVDDLKEFAFHGDLLTDDEKAKEPKESLHVWYADMRSKASAPVRQRPTRRNRRSSCSATATRWSSTKARPVACTRTELLTDHLQAALGFKVDLVANKGSGADTARVSLYRRGSEPGYWESKKLVVWCFSEREFTRGKWRAVPVKR
ncbi:MAG: hypothetical protein R3F11_13535 [Verrucomicrobiales bacterium]